MQTTKRLPEFKNCHTHYGMDRQIGIFILEANKIKSNY